MFRVRLKIEVGGFTTIELLLTLAVFAILVPSLLGSVVLINNLNNRAEDLIYSNIVAENKFESLRSAGYNTISTGTTDFTNELSNQLASPKSASYVVTSPTTNTKEIEITISYYDRGKVTTNQYTSVISELGVAQ